MTRFTFKSCFEHILKRHIAFLSQPQFLDKYFQICIGFTNIASRVNIKIDSNKCDCLLYIFFCAYFGYSIA
mgnify:CR=1 FL=1